MNRFWWCVACVIAGGCSALPVADAGAEVEVDAGFDAGLEVDAGLVVPTSSGPVEGETDGGVSRFFGIPYAAPPVGELRWKPPVAPSAWTAPLSAKTFGQACPQADDATIPQGEDCLTLNVWTPRLDPTAGLPVMVFVHGGSFRNGSGSRSTYDGTALATRFGVVVVTLNYRLGALGFLAHPALTAESAHHSSGNYGVMDQQAALRWVQQNVSAFGGDPTRVTLFGESAGSISVCTQVVSPLAAGLFQRGIGESGSCLITTTTLQTAEARGSTFAQTLGCSDAACLRQLTLAQVLSVPPVPADAEFGLGLASPNVDGWVLPEAPAVAMAAGRINPIEAFIGGVNRDEATIFTRGHVIDTQAQLEAAVAAVLPTHVNDVLALYPPNSVAYPSFKAVYDALATDLLFVCPTKRQLAAFQAAGVHSFLYRFEKTTAGGVAAGLGVYHASELPFVFGTLSANAPASQIAVSAQLGERWTTFAKTGVPGAVTGPAWPEFTTDTFLRLDDVSSAQQALRTTECAALAGWQ